jgi:hypothetical protein
MHEAERNDGENGPKETETHGNAPRRASVLGIAVALLVLGLFLFLHLSGAVGPSAH